MLGERWEGAVGLTADHRTSDDGIISPTNTSSQYSDEMISRALSPNSDTAPIQNS